MKKMFSKWMVLAFCSCFVLSSCDKDDDKLGEIEPETTLSVNVQDVLSFMESGEMKDVIVTTNQLTWKARMLVWDDTTWCKLSQNKDTLKIKILQNVSGALRTGKIKIVAGEGEKLKEKELTINQGSLKTYKLFELYNVKGVKGIIYELNEDKMSGKILSLTEKITDDFVPSMDYYRDFIVGATEEDDGATNMATIKEKVATWEIEYPVVAWVEKMNVGGVTGWYLPAINEAMKIISIYDIFNFDGSKGALNTALMAAGGDTIQAPRLNSATMKTFIPELAFGSSTTLMDGRVAKFFIVGYTISIDKNAAPEMKAPRKGDYIRNGYAQRTAWGDNTAYQFRAIRKF